MTAKNATLPQIVDLITSGQAAAKERWDDMRLDIDQKHKENSERRHAIVNTIAQVEGRVALAEGQIKVMNSTITSIVGDNSGVSGMLNEIKGTVKELQSDMAIVKQVVQDTPSINKYIYGVMAVLAFLVFAIPISLTVVFFVVEVILKFLVRH